MLVLPEGAASESDDQSQEALAAKVQASGADYLSAVNYTLTEWNSEADNSAYRHL
ncbi:MAG: hypothetical protein VKJ27_11645 [Synechocystis sp.]|nr:hypothetical protein [Synechocystis sp.]